MRKAQGFSPGTCPERKALRRAGAFLRTLAREFRVAGAVVAVMVGLGIGVCGQRAGHAGAARPASGDAAKTASISRDGSGAGGLSTTKNSPTDPAHFALRIYGKRVDVKYQYADLTAAVGDLASQEPVVTLTEDDVAFIQADAAPSSRLLLGLTDQASRRWSAALTGMKDTQPFTVSLDGRTLYVGVVYTMMGAAAIQTPVLHIQDNKGRVELRIGAWQGAWYGMGRGDASRVEQKEVRALFEKRGVLSTLPAR